MKEKRDNIDKSKIERNKYKSFCMIIKDCFFRKKINELYTLIKSLYNFKNVNKLNNQLFNVYFKGNNNQLVERNQFAILMQMVSIYDQKDLNKEFYIIKSRYSISQHLKNKKKVFKGEINE